MFLWNFCIIEMTNCFYFSLSPVSLKLTCVTSFMVKGFALGSFLIVKIPEHEAGRHRLLLIKCPIL